MYILFKVEQLLTAIKSPVTAVEQEDGPVPEQVMWQRYLLTTDRMKIHFREYIPGIEHSSFFPCHNSSPLIMHKKLRWFIAQPYHKTSAL
jgi:hypothetical protein